MTVNFQKDEDATEEALAGSIRKLEAMGAVVVRKGDIISATFNTQKAWREFQLGLVAENSED